MKWTKISFMSGSFHNYHRACTLGTHSFFDGLLSFAAPWSANIKCFLELHKLSISIRMDNNNYYGWMIIIIMHTKNFIVWYYSAHSNHTVSNLWCFTSACTHIHTHACIHVYTYSYLYRGLWLLFGALPWATSWFHIRRLPCLDVILWALDQTGSCSESTMKF